MQPVCELLPQTLSLHVVDVLIAVGGVNDLGTGINKGINLFAFQSLYRSFHCLIAHVIAELRDIHAERTVLDGGDSGGIAVKAADDGVSILGVAGVLDDLNNAHCHVIVGGKNNINAVRIHLHNGFHCGCSLLSQTVAVLHLNDLAAGFLNAFLVAGQTCFVRLVALYAGNDKDSRLVNTVRLGGFYGCRAAALGSVLVAGADKRELLVRGKVGIECDYNLIGVRNQRGSRIRLQRSQYQRVNARNSFHQLTSCP